MDVNVGFKEEIFGLDQLKEIDLQARDPEEVPSTICNEQCDPQCVKQKSTMEEIFEHFDIPTVNDKHSCFYEGINCNTDGFVTDIWFGEQRK